MNFNRKNKKKSKSNANISYFLTNFTNIEFLFLFLAFLKLFFHLFYLSLETLELFNRVLTKLDIKQDKIVKDESPQDTANRICEFLRILGYPSNFSMFIEMLLIKLIKFVLANFNKDLFQEIRG